MSHLNKIEQGAAALDVEKTAAVLGAAVDLLLSLATVLAQEADTADVEEAAHYFFHISH